MKRAIILLVMIAALYASLQASVNTNGLSYVQIGAIQLLRDYGNFNNVPRPFKLLR